MPTVPIVREETLDSYAGALPERLPGDVLRSLSHVSVARSLARVATISSAGQMAVHIAFPDGFHLDGGSGHHLILFAQEKHQGAIEGAATTRL